MAQRSVAKIVAGHPSVDGAGVHLVRVLGAPTVYDFDPFLMLDAFDSYNPADYIRGFPMHPHRGIETFTYLMEGEIDHQDSLGHQGRILDGCCQWMTAGNGILHQEMPRATDRLLGLQLWINLPRAHKMADPKYRDITPALIPVQQEDGAEVAVVAGSYPGPQGTVNGATKGDYTPVRFLDVRLVPGKIWEVETEPDDTVFAYLVQGSCRLGELELPTRRAALFTTGDVLRLTGGPGGARFVLVSGRPLHEPVAWGGPIVMNTEAEVRQAFQELEDGTFLRHMRRR